MLLKSTDDPDILSSLKHGSLIVKAFGLPITIMGGMALNSLARGGPKGAGFELPMAIGIGCTGLVFTFVGLIMFLGTIGVRVNRRNRTLETWIGIFVPVWKKTFDISDGKCILITKEFREGTRREDGHAVDTYTVYPVYIKGAEQADVDEFEDHLASRKLAEQLAKFLNIPLVDTSHGGGEAEDPASFDIPLIARLKRLNSAPAPVARPSATLAEVSSTAEHSLVIEIPPLDPDGHATTKTGAALLGPIAALGAMAAVPDLGTTLMADPKHLALAGLAFVIGTGGAMFYALRAAGRQKSTFTVRLSTSQLEIEAKALLYSAKTVIPIAELKDISLPDESGWRQEKADQYLRRNPFKGVASGLPLLARSNNCEVAFGEKLHYSEKKYLYSLLIAKISQLPC